VKKKQLTLLAILLCTILITTAQQPWRFHIAFEDGSGQRDTLWMVFDTTATEGIDYQLGEGTPEYDPNAFNVFMYNMNVDSTKVKAYPYWIYPTMSTDEDFAINYTYPVIIRWDTALFHAPYLPNNPPANPPMNVAIIEGSYQFFVLGFDPTAPYFHTTNMFTKDSVFCPEDTNGPTHVPLFGDLGFIFGYDPYLSIETLITKNISIFPNPSSGLIKINCNIPVTSYIVTQISGKSAFQEAFHTPKILNNYEIPYQKLCSGMYIESVYKLKLLITF
jgi:hypothetical protein